VDFELQKTEGFTLMELFKPQNFKLCCVAFVCLELFLLASVGRLTDHL